MKYIITIWISLSFLQLVGQVDKTKHEVEKDTLLSKLLNDLPKEMHKEFMKEYNKMTTEERTTMFALFDLFTSMPTSSKKALTQNIDTNYANIIALKTYFKNIVPANYVIFIEFNPPDKMLKMDESIDFWAFCKNKETNDYVVIFQESNIELNSTKLDSLLHLTTLKRQDLRDLKMYLDKANCISVYNKDAIEIGYARSGMGKYSYLIFDKSLTEEEKDKYNNGCEYIFYKDNIVLEYGGGAIGSQCFPDIE
jgi:hypothetical protein